MKINVTSTAVEKGIDLAKNFLEKLVVPAVEETGLLIKDQISSWRFNNQIKVLNKAKEYCEKHKISPKQVSFKLICPLLDYASLEEEEKLQDKWSILISNLVDSAQNIENHVFPYILSQISLNEYESLEMSFLVNKDRIEGLKKENEIHSKEYPVKEKYILDKIEEHKSNIFKQIKYKQQYADLKNNLMKISNLIHEPGFLYEGGLKEFEVSNLVRLGLVRNIVDYYAKAEPITFPSISDLEYGMSILDVNIGISRDHEYYNLTELGELFIKACTEKE